MSPTPIYSGERLLVRGVGKIIDRDGEARRSLPRFDEWFTRRKLELVRSYLSD